MKLIHTDLKPENVLLKSWEDREVTLDSGDIIRVPVNPHIKGESRKKMFRLERKSCQSWLQDLPVNAWRP